MARETDALIGHAKIESVIVMALRARRIPPSEFDDLVSAVRVAAWEWTVAAGRPTTLDGWCALTSAIAKRMAVDELRRKARRAPFNVGLAEDADQYGALPYHGAESPIDMRQSIAELRDLFQQGKLPRDIELILEGLQDELTLKEIAAANDVSYEALRQQRAVAKKTVTERFQALGLPIPQGYRRRSNAALAAVVGVAVLLLYVFSRPRDPVAHGGADAGVTPTPSSPVPNAPDPSVLAKREAEKRAAELTLQAEQAKNDKDWAACVEAATAAYQTNAGDGPRLANLSTTCATAEAAERNLGMGKARGDAATKAPKPHGSPEQTK